MDSSADMSVQGISIFLGKYYSWIGKLSLKYDNPSHIYKEDPIREYKKSVSQRVG